MYDYKTRRKALKITQTQLAHLSNLSLPQVQKLERGEGNPSLSTLERLGAVLGFDVKAVESEVNWPMLAAAGLPLSVAPQMAAWLTSMHIVVELRKAWLADLSGREREAVCAMIFALKRHYPSVGKKYFSDVSFETLSYGRILKLSRIALAKLQNYF